ncbi:permease prefix domain 1-containing protein [Brevibacterium daeguense]|uniref:Permease prefix domain 1-containing protein n=1 Tax=Brevibacterium daeguense TaxID=909936 RepID=A0ABP8EIE9_9MICO|nr:hypothetical protein [Brevibacterium daeguense]
MSALTDKYVDAVVQHLPEPSRNEIAEEISAIISDMVEGRLNDQHRADPEVIRSVERQTLEELGDPAALARRYADHPQHLIGPNLYPVYVRLLQWFLPIVGVIAFAINALVYSLTAPVVAIGDLLGASIGNTVVALLSWFASITILLAAVERIVPQEHLARFPGSRTRAWSVDQLDESVSPGASVRSESVLSIVFLVLFASVPLLPTTLFYVGHLNDGSTFVNPDLWPGWILGFWALIAVLIAVEVWKLIVGRLTRSLVVTSVVVDVLAAVLLTVAVLTQQVIHPDLAAASGPGGAGGALEWVLVAAIWFVTVWDQIATIRAYRSRLTNGGGAKRAARRVARRRR